MRKTPIPLLRDLPPFTRVDQCRFCGHFVFANEACQGGVEAASCPPRFVVDYHAIIEREAV